MQIKTKSQKKLIEVDLEPCNLDPYIKICFDTSDIPYHINQIGQFRYHLIPFDGFPSMDGVLAIEVDSDEIRNKIYRHRMYEYMSYVECLDRKITEIAINSGSDYFKYVNKLFPTRSPIEEPPYIDVVKTNSPGVIMIDTDSIQYCFSDINIFKPMNHKIKMRCNATRSDHSDHIETNEFDIRRQVGLNVIISDGFLKVQMASLNEVYEFFGLAEDTGFYNAVLEMKPTIIGDIPQLKITLTYFLLVHCF